MELLTLNILATHWRQALDDAEDTLVDLSRSSRILRFSALELRERMEELRWERHEIELDLEALARTSHLPVRRRLDRSRESPANVPSSR